MASKVTNVVFAGLGGQGVLKASDIMSETAFKAGLDVKKSEVHGMSQRGGSVTSDVRFGQEVLSPMVPAGEADYLVVLEAVEVDHNRGLLREGGVLIEPSLIGEGVLRNPKSLNVALLGALSAHLDIDEEVWLSTVRDNLPVKLHDVNVQAFAAGRAAAKAV
ncbi:MAG: indolepyruvate oxidoreductase subunit beta [Phycisphaerae bacterium]|nr:indolepyruvate oxidoreductase subunit beta [Phycisphaerae bacterium]